MTLRAELSLAADGLPMELPLLQVQTGPHCVGAAEEKTPCGSLAVVFSA